MDNNEVIVENEDVQDNGTEELLIQDFPTEDNDDNTAGKLGFAIMGLGALAIGGGVVALINKIKSKKAEKSEATEEKPAKKEKKQKVKKVRGAKLTLHEKLTGYRDEDPPEEEIEEESNEG